MRLPAEDGKRLMHSEIKVGEARIFVRDAFPEHCPGGGANGGKYGSPKVYGGTAVTLHPQVAKSDATVKQSGGPGPTVVVEAWGGLWGDRSAMVKQWKRG